MSLISIFFIPSFYYWVDWCAYLFIGPFNIDSFGCEVPELKGKEKKRPMMLGMCCHDCVFLKKEVPICQVLVLWGSPSTQALSSSWSFCPTQRQTLSFLYRVSLSRLSHCLVCVVELLLTTQRLCFPICWMGIKTLQISSCCFEGELRCNAGKRVNVMPGTESTSAEWRADSRPPGFASCLCQLLAVWP